LGVITVNAGLSCIIIEFSLHFDLERIKRLFWNEPAFDPVTVILTILRLHHISAVGPSTDAVGRPPASDMYKDVVWVIVVSDDELPFMLGPQPDLHILPNVSLLERVHRWHEVGIPRLGDDDLSYGPLDVYAKRVQI